MGTSGTLLPTFDYELFLGRRSGRPEDCLFGPTDRVLEILDQHGFSALFFIDTTYLWALHRYRDQYSMVEEDLRHVEAHIKKLIERGHRIFPHLHPHWLDAQYMEESGEWDLSDHRRYRFHVLDEPEKDELFSFSMEILGKYLKEVGSTQGLNAFRAGGWSIQPFSHFRPYFEKYGIEHDLSVLKGACAFTDAQYFDFRDAPSEDVYRFDHELIEKEDDGRFQEICISTVNIGQWRWKLDKFGWKFLRRLPIGQQYGKGISVEGRPIEENFAPDHGMGDPVMASIELMDDLTLPVFKRMIKKRDTVCLISHPKMFTPYNLAAFSRFLKAALKTHSKKLPEDLGIGKMKFREFY